ncbi:glycosyl transferase, family 25 [Citreimonas salinaria]|uniref:Glycosyl transferase, family 25 n=2 Tax=Citreimonas salinaria TaxID=321339 RepID=A0A1H3HUR3_9RHOB|nr:glycosyl transferase, family 25 [Citreimonas salinaria]
MAAIGAALEREGVAYSRLPATDGRSLSASDRILYSASRSILYTGRRLKDSEIGCYISHVRAANAFLASGDNLGLVLEDDVKLPSDFSSRLQRLREIVDEMEAGSWEVGNLGKAPTPKYRKHVGTLDAEHEVVRAYRFPIRASAVLWTRQGAARFVAEAYPIAAPVDVKIQVLATLSGKGVATVPELIPTSGAVSDIDPTGGPRKGQTRTGLSLPAAAMKIRQGVLRRVARRNMRKAGTA